MERIQTGCRKPYDPNASIRESIHSTFQGINGLLVFVLDYLGFFLAYEGKDNKITVTSHIRHFLPRVDIKNYDIEIDGRIFYYQPINNQEINDLIKHAELCWVEKSIDRTRWWLHD